MQLFFIKPTECTYVTKLSHFIKKLRIKYEYHNDQFQLEQSYTFMTINLGNGTDALLFLQYLEHTQSLHADQAEILNQLSFVLQSQNELGYIYSYQISSYLCKNIEKGMNIIQTVGCMLNLHSLLRSEDKQRMSFFLERQYKLQDSWEELKKLQKVNTTLIPNFLQVINGLGEWYRIEIQQREFMLVQKKDCINQLDVLYTTSRYQFENKTELSFKTEQPLLCLYRLLFENQFLFGQLIKEEIYVQKLYCSLFYVSSFYTLSLYKNHGERNFQFQEIQQSQLKVVIFVIGEIYAKIQNFWRQGKKKMLIENYRQSIQKNALNGQDECQQRIKAGISGLIASKVSMDKELELLWVTLILLDIKAYSASKQSAILKEIKYKSVKLRILLEHIPL